MDFERSNDDQSKLTDVQVRQLRKLVKARMTPSRVIDILEVDETEFFKHVHAHANDWKHYCEIYKDGVKTATYKKKFDAQFDAQLKVFMRLYPALQDVADFFGVKPDSISEYIRDNYHQTYDQFRNGQQGVVKNYVFSLLLERAKKGSDRCLIYLADLLLKNNKDGQVAEVVINYAPGLKKLQEMSVSPMAQQYLDHKPGGVDGASSG